MGLGLTLLSFTAHTTMLSTNVNSNFSTINALASLTLPFTSFSADGGVLASDGQGNLLFGGKLGKTTIGDIYDGSSSNVIWKATTSVGPITFEIPSLSQILQIDLGGWTMQSGGVTLPVGSLSRTSSFFGSSTGTYNHLNNGTPDMCLPFNTDNNYDDIGFDGAGQVQVHITNNNAGNFECICIGF